MCEFRAPCRNVSQKPTNTSADQRLEQEFSIKWSPVAPQTCSKIQLVPEQGRPRGFDNHTCSRWATWSVSQQAPFRIHLHQKPAAFGANACRVSTWASEKKKKRILRTRCIFIRLGAAEHGTPSHPQSSSRLACANKRFKRLLRFSSPTRNLKLLILNTCTVAWLRAAMEHRFLSTMSRHTCKGQLLSNT